MLSWINKILGISLRLTKIKIKWRESRKIIMVIRKIKVITRKINRLEKVGSKKNIIRMMVICKNINN
jgi:hypothetical protein